MRAEEVEEGESRQLSMGHADGEYSTGVEGRCGFASSMSFCNPYDRVIHFLSHLCRGETNVERLKYLLNISDEVLREYRCATNLQEHYQTLKQPGSPYIKACFAFLKQTANEVADFELVDIVRWVAYHSPTGPCIHIHLKVVCTNNAGSDHQLFCASVARLSNPLRHRYPECRVLGCIPLPSKCPGDNSGIPQKCLVRIPEISPCTELPGGHPHIVKARNVGNKASSVKNAPLQQNQRWERAFVSLGDRIPSVEETNNCLLYCRLDEFVKHLILGDTDLEYLKLKLNITDQILQEYKYPKNMEELNQNRWDCVNRYFDACFAWFKQKTNQADEFKLREVRYADAFCTEDGHFHHNHFEVMRISNVVLDHSCLELFCVQFILSEDDTCCVLRCDLLEPNCLGDNDEFLCKCSRGITEPCRTKDSSEDKAKLNSISPMTVALKVLTLQGLGF